MEKKLNVVIEKRKLSDLKPLKNNAHYMDKAEFDLLVSNIKKDGCLTSLPVIYDGDIPGEIISGNHRVKAAMAAGIEEADVLSIKSELSKEQKIAIQLSHNSIKGKDDPNLLQALYESIEDLDFKYYSGVTDDDFKVQEVELVPLSQATVKPELVTLAFLPTDKQVFLDYCDKLKKLSDKQSVLVARAEDFDYFYNAVLMVKSEYGIINLAVAVREMAQLAMKQIENERKQDDSETDDEET